MLAGACSDTERAPPLNDFGLGAVQTYPGCEHIDFQSCYVDNRDCQQRVFDAVTCAREVDSGDAPDVELVTQDELVDILAEEGGLTPAADPDTELALARMGLLAPDIAAASGESTGVPGIAGLYLPGSDRVILVLLDVEKSWPVIAVLVLAHEYTHYLQARDIDLESIGEDGTPFDVTFAMISTIEGEASLYENLVGGVFTGVDYERNVAETHLELLREDVKDLTVDLGPPLNSVRAIFPYTFGFSYAAESWRAGGPPEVRTLLDNLPMTTREIMTPEESFDTRDVVDVELPAAPESWSLIDEDTLGAWVLYGLLSTIGEDVDVPFDDSLAWRGDRFGSYVADGEVVGLWRIEFSSADAARSAAEILDQAVPFLGRIRALVDGSQLTLLAASSSVTEEEWLAVLE